MASGPSHAENRLERVDVEAVTLESVIAVLRSSRLDDRAARAMATDIAAMALVDIRTPGRDPREESLEPVAGAFGRLTRELRPLARHGDVTIQFVEPPAEGRALPGEVARGARAIVHSALLLFLQQRETSRVRIQWGCDGLNLLIEVRDDGSGELAVSDDALRPIVERVSRLNGVLTVASTAGWGSVLSIRIPLDVPARPYPLDEEAALTAREREVLGLIASGARNKAIAGRLGISENTVKFHVSNLLRKSEATSRAELVARARSRRR